MSVKPLTIVHIITSLDVGGAERSLANLVLGLDRCKFNNIVISLKDLGFWGPILHKQGIEVIALNMQCTSNSIQGLITLWRVLRKIKPDYVQGWMYHANIVALLIGKLARVPKIYWNIRCSLMDLSKYSLLTRVTFKLGKIFAKWPTGIINNSKNSIQEHIEYGYINNNLIHIPNGFDIEKFKFDNQRHVQFREKYNLPKDCIIIGMIARFDPMKDHQTFIEAAGILAKENKNVYFVCAGKDVNKENVALQVAINKYELQENIILLGPQENLHELYPAFDYLAQTSIFGEGFPNVVAEAMACGVACFVTDVGDSLTVIGDCGHIIEKQDPKQIAATWQKVIQQNNVNRDKIRARIVDYFSIEKCISAYSEVYNTKT